MLARLSSDALRLQCDHANHLVSKHPAVAKNIILGLIASIEFHMNNKSNFELTKDLQSVSFLIFRKNFIINVYSFNFVLICHTVDFKSFDLSLRLVSCAAETIFVTDM